MTLQKIFLPTVAAVIALIFAASVAAIVLLAVGVSPVETLQEMWSFGTTPASIVSVVNRAIPLYISALAVAIGFKMNLFNIGVEGQYLMAAVIAAWAGAQFSLWAPLHVLVIVVIAAGVGAGYAGIAGLLRVRRGVSEVISTIMLNFIALGVTSWLVANYFRDRVEGNLNVFTASIPESGRIPPANWIVTIFGVDVGANDQVQGFVVGAIVLGVFYHLLVQRSRFGFELRASGLSPMAATFSGVNSKAMILKAMLLSGGFAGLVGIAPLLGFFHRYVNDFPRNLGFNGIAVALLGRNHPVGMALAALLWGFLDRSAQILDLRGIPKEIAVIVQGFVVLAVVVAYEVVNRTAEKRTVAAAAQATADADDEPARETA